MDNCNCGEVMCDHAGDSDQLRVVPDKYSEELDSIKLKTGDKRDEIRKARSSDVITLGQFKKLRAEMSEI